MSDNDHQPKEKTKKRSTHRGRSSADGVLLLAMASGRTVLEAAEAAGVSPATATRRLADPEFRALLDRARDDLLRVGLEKLTQLAVKAGDVLERLLGEGPADSVRLGAVRTTYEHLVKHREHFLLDRRLVELEERLRRMLQGSESAQGENE